MGPMSEGPVTHDSLGLGPGFRVSLCEAAIPNSPASFLVTEDHKQALPNSLGHNLLSPLPKSTPPHCTGILPWGIFCPGFCVLRRKKRV